MHQSVSSREDIHECFRNAAASQPAYQKMLPFFEHLYEIQESAVSGTHPQGMDEMESSRPPQNESRTPLLERKDFSIDTASAERLLSVICKTARDQGPKMARAAEVLAAGIENDDRAIRRVFEWFLCDDQAALKSFSQELGMDRPVLIFFLYHSIWPSLARQVRYIEAQKRIDPHWPHPYCPICGSPPNLAYLSDDTGKRFLVCGFCRHDWPVQRILCPYCTHDHPDGISYFFSEEEPAYRVYTCDQCLRYIKTVDTRQLSRRFYAPLESLMTLHLDLHAESMGYSGGEDLHLFGG